MPMAKFLKQLRHRLLQGIHLTEGEHATVDAVIERMRQAIRKNRGIRLTKDELRVLALFGLKKQIDEGSTHPDDLK